MPVEWAKNILHVYDKYKRIDCTKAVKQSGYEIKNEAIKLEKLYTQILLMN